MLNETYFKALSDRNIWQVYKWKSYHQERHAGLKHSRMKKGLDETLLVALGYIYKALTENSYMGSIVKQWSGRKL
jgi:hypothetical protein